MKIDIVEKVGEIIVTELRPASLNAEITSAELARQAEIRAIEKAKRDKEDQMASAQVLAVLSEKMNAAAERGQHMIYLEWNRNSNPIKNLSFDRWEHLVKNYIGDILKGLGYKIYSHEYSDSWKRKSGKIGHYSIHWM